MKDQRRGCSSTTKIESTNKNTIGVQRQKLSWYPVTFPIGSTGPSKRSPCVFSEWFQSLSLSMPNQEKKSPKALSCTNAPCRSTLFRTGSATTASSLVPNENSRERKIPNSRCKSDSEIFQSAGVLPRVEEPRCEMVDAFPSRHRSTPTLIIRGSPRSMQIEQTEFDLVRESESLQDLPRVCSVSLLPYMTIRPHIFHIRTVDSTTQLIFFSLSLQTWDVLIRHQ